TAVNGSQTSFTGGTVDFGINAIGTANLSGTTVASVTVTSGGSGYTGAPTVTFTGGGTPTVAATGLGTFGVASVTVNTAGSGYTSAPTVSFTGGGGSGAAGFATVSGGFVSGITLTSGGSGYTS